MVAGKFVRHDPRTWEGGELALCPGSKRRAPLDATHPTLAAFPHPPSPGQLPLF
ncbi:hypothetical protein DWB77_04032 [Streptomyces hundungensis]|uniref:Uncharacterized protein n=1 Tax=Streptomyces hundungensis TaxID=1077946 RepID=A0A387HDD4_9ACTN|nr:hypothetical protein DWB77_04032 [Streptomyces hundungensis]